MPSFGRGEGQPGSGESHTHVATAAASAGYGPPEGTAQPQKPCAYEHVSPTSAPQCCPTGTVPNDEGQSLPFEGVGHWLAFGVWIIHEPAEVQFAIVLH